MEECQLSVNAILENNSVLKQKSIELTTNAFVLLINENIKTPEEADFRNTLLALVVFPRSVSKCPIKVLRIARSQAYSFMIHSKFTVKHATSIYREKQFHVRS